ncbi:MAG TPA: cell division FtsA domain-containing protein [Candidatus Dormibacteraeota bacterium]|nr:cell division FtsA domain-containing protein [Candidatus Dormibacteraeota bacterium]
MALKFIEKFKKGGQAAQYLVALDIGTEFVKALVGQVVGDPGGNQTVEILGVGRQRQRLTDMQSGAVTDIAGVVDNCDAALKAAEKMSGVVARDAVVGIAGELVKGTSTTVRYKRTNPTDRIEMLELRKILDRVQVKAYDKAKENLAWETGQQDIDVKMVNTAIVDVQIDGYRVTNPIGFQGRDVTIQLFNAFAPMVHIGALQSVANNLDLNLINIAAEPFAVAKSVGDDQSADFSAIFIDIGGGTTDIAVVNNGGVEGTKMFAIGGRSFTKRIAQIAGVSFEKAEQMKLEYSAGKMEKPEDRKAVEEAVNADINVWLSGVELSLAEFTRLDHLPAKILLCGGGTGLPQVVQALQGEWYKRLHFARQPIVSHISPKEVNRVVDKTGQLTSHADITPMGLANLGLDVINTGSITESVMQKLSKTLQA